MADELPSLRGAAAHLPLLTDRLRLRELREEDLEELTAILGDPAVMRYFPALKYRDDVRAWLGRHLDRYARDGAGLWAVERLEDGAFVGDCGLMVQQPGGVPEVEVGYHFARGAWGRGYATEAARACAQLALGPLALARVVAMVRPENAPSRAVALRLGMRVEKQIQHAGYLHDLFVRTR